jgi:hypothetical protein
MNEKNDDEKQFAGAASAKQVSRKKLLFNEILNNKRYHNP